MVIGRNSIQVDAELWVNKSIVSVLEICCIQMRAQIQCNLRSTCHLQKLMLFNNIYLFLKMGVPTNNKGRQIIKYSINVGGREMVLGGTKRRAIFIVTHLSPFCIIQTWDRNGKREKHASLYHILTMW